MNSYTSACLKIFGTTEEEQIWMEHTHAAVCRVLEEHHDISAEDEAYANFVFHGGDAMPAYKYSGITCEADDDLYTMCGDDSVNVGLLSLLAQAYLRRFEKPDVLTFLYNYHGDDAYHGVLGGGFVVVTAGKIEQHETQRTMELRAAEVANSE